MIVAADASAAVPSLPGGAAPGASLLVAGAAGAPDAFAQMFALLSAWQDPNSPAARVEKKPKEAGADDGTLLAGAAPVPWMLAAPLVINHASFGAASQALADKTGGPAELLSDGLAPATGSALVSKPASGANPGTPDLTLPSEPLPPKLAQTPMKSATPAPADRPNLNRPQVIDAQERPALPATPEGTRLTAVSHPAEVATATGVSVSIQVVSAMAEAAPQGGDTTKHDADDKDTPGSAASNAVAPTLTGPGAGALNPPVESARPSAALTDQVHDHVAANLDQLRSAGHAEVQMNLHPPELGPVQLHLALDDEQVNVRFLVQSDGAKAALSHQMEPMRVRFAEMGFSLGQFDVRRDSDSSNWQQAQEPAHSGQWGQTQQASGRSTPKAYAAVTNPRSLVDVIA